MNESRVTFREGDKFESKVKSINAWASLPCSGKFPKEQLSSSPVCTNNLLLNKTTWIYLWTKQNPNTPHRRTFNDSLEEEGETGNSAHTESGQGLASGSDRNLRANGGGHGTDGAASGGRALGTLARNGDGQRSGRSRAVDLARGDGVALLALADDLLEAVITLALLVAALVTVADPVLVALIAVALLVDAVVTVADNLLVALIALADGVVAVITLTLDELVVVLVVVGALLGVAVVVLADDAVLDALVLVAGSLGSAPVTVADDDLLVPDGSGAGAVSGGDGGGGGLSDGAVRDIIGASSDGTSAGDGLGDGLGSRAGSRGDVAIGNADVDGQENGERNRLAAGQGEVASEATAELVVVSRAGGTAEGVGDALGVIAVDGLTAVAITVWSAMLVRMDQWILTCCRHRRSGKGSWQRRGRGSCSRRRP